MNKRITVKIDRETYYKAYKYVVKQKAKGKKASVSQFIREAISEKLKRI